MAKFKPLNNGIWGLIGTAAEMVPGRTVTVYKGNGDRVEKTVGSIVSRDGALVVCEIAGQKASRVQPRSYRGRSRYASRPQTVATSYGSPVVSAQDIERNAGLDREFYDEQRAELEACGIPDHELPPRTTDKVHDASKFDVDFTDFGARLMADASDLGPDWMTVCPAGTANRYLVVKFNSGVLRFRLSKIDLTPDNETAGWRFDPATPEAAAKIAGVLVVND